MRFRIVRRRRRHRGPDARHYREHKNHARTVILARLRYWNGMFGFTYGRVAIRNQRSRWGSCSTKGNLNFNYRLAFLPEPLIDYVIVHELCHLQHFNHSPSFWAAVGTILADYRERRAALRRISIGSSLTGISL